MSKRRREPQASPPDILTSIRLTSEVLERADALIPILGRDPAITAIGSVSRAVVLRLAMVSGLDALERKYREETTR